ncbi:MAG: DUF6190 family protein [bacterium]|nr:DUF6190 family protein [bacterium]
MKEFIDATVFMGMHSTDEERRVACKNFFVERMEKTIFMSYENVGKCDDIVWSFDRETQDAYYPFMDRLHTAMDVQRIPYDERTLERRASLSDLSVLQQLTLALSRAHAGRLRTFDGDLLRRDLDDVSAPHGSKIEKEFSSDLEKWYRESLQLRVDGTMN